MASMLKTCIIGVVLVVQEVLKFRHYMHIKISDKCSTMNVQNKINKTPPSCCTDGS